MVAVGGSLSGCASNSSAPPPSQPGHPCPASAGPRGPTVDAAIAGLPVEVPGSAWVEIARGHTTSCRLYWVQVIPTLAAEDTGQQLLFFDHDSALGTPTAHSKPYTTVLAVSEDTVTVQYQWRTGADKVCCPSGRGRVRYQIGPNGSLKALDAMPH